MDDLLVDLNDRNTEFHKWYRANYKKEFPYSGYQVHILFRNLKTSKKLNGIQKVFDRYHNESKRRWFGVPLDIKTLN